MNAKSDGRPHNPQYEAAKKIVASIKAKNPELSPAKIHEQTAKRISQLLREKHPKDTDKEIEIMMKAYLPSKSWVRDHVKEVVTPAIKSDEQTGIDNAWSLDKTIDLPADAIAAIFNVQKWLETNKDTPFIKSVPGWTEWVTGNRMTATVWPLTIREAQWIARLFKVEIKFYSLPGNTYELWYLAKAYADYQRLCKIAGIDFDTTPLDEGIRKENISEVKRDL